MEIENELTKKLYLVHGTWYFANCEKKQVKRLYFWTLLFKINNPSINQKPIRNLHYILPAVLVVRTIERIKTDKKRNFLQNYHKREVMALALPVAVKFLHKGNKELSRNMSSYLSLAAIEAADLLAMHIQPIIDSVISGKSVLWI